MIFALVLASTVILGAAMLVPEPLAGHGVVHSRFASMSSGGSPAERTGAILWLGWAFGALQLLLFGALMSFGARRRGFALPLWLCVAVYLGLFTAVVVAYWAGADESIQVGFLGFPLATAILIYGLWPWGGLFTLCFALGFRRWVLSEEDLSRYVRLLESEGRSDPGCESGVDPETARETNC